ncbi:hypothetical protein HPB51_017910 [Rhipicephalus microplus]|uniref:Arrestin C-terminal-like domain-containing protein n=1 Tax=Rhipicephalus microplus TaxID=6941 RepID=A0A9J6F5G9_RHIMP|nr:hypothetical protein HPB51_017910 [Rhipicephalus microplus]
MSRKLQKFLVLLDNETLLYFPGSFLSGKVVVELDEEIAVTEPAAASFRRTLPTVPPHAAALAAARAWVTRHKVGPILLVIRSQDFKLDGCALAISDFSVAPADWFALRGLLMPCLYFHIVGEGVVRLTDKSKVNTSDRENYIDFRMRLLGENTPKGSPARVVFLSPGVHSFPFKLGLPLGLPSTFLGKHGWVQYFCKAALKEPSGLTHKNQQVFIVMSPIDLNLEPTLLTQPFHCEVEESLGMACFSSGRLSCRVRLDKGGYVPGESICIFASIENNTRVTIRKTRAVLTEFIISPKGPGKEIRLQLPIMMATYPIRNSDGTLQRKKGTHYPTVLPVFRPWLNTDKFKT